MKHLTLIVISLIIFNKTVSSQTYTKGTIITEDSIIKNCDFGNDFLSHQYIKIKNQSNPIELKNVISVTVKGKKYIKVDRIRGGIVKGSTTFTSKYSLGGTTPTATIVRGSWLVNILTEGKYSLGETLPLPVSKDLMKILKERYVRGSFMHIITGDKTNGDNYISILGSKKTKKKKLKTCFKGYPEILKIIDEMDFSKSGYTQATINQFIEIVNKYNSLQ